jgi:hypothetical protein
MQNRNKGPIHKTAAASQDREDIRADRREALELKFVKRVLGMSSGLWKIRNRESMEGSAPSEAEKEAALT